MKNQKVSTTLGTVILIIIAATVTGFTLLCIKNMSIKTDLMPVVVQPQLQKKVVEVEKDKIEILSMPMNRDDWKTYSNNTYGLVFKYPKNWEIVEENKIYGSETVFINLEKENLFHFNLINWKKFVIKEGTPGTFWQKIAQSRWKYFVDHRDDIVPGKCSSEVISHADGPTAADTPKECVIEKGKNYVKVETESNLCFYGNENEICVTSNKDVFDQLDPIITTIELKGY